MTYRDFVLTHWCILSREPCSFISSEALGEIHKSRILAIEGFASQLVNTKAVFGVKTLRAASDTHKTGHKGQANEKGADEV